VLATLTWQHPGQRMPSCARSALLAPHHLLLLSRLPNLPTSHQVTRVPIEDFNGDELVRLVKEGARAVDRMYCDAQARGQKPKIYIHCTAGMGRAPGALVSVVCDGVSVWLFGSMAVGCVGARAWVGLDGCAGMGGC